MAIKNDKLGISTNIFDNPEDINSLVLKYASLGFQAIEIEIDNAARKILGYPKPILKSFLEELNKIKIENGLSLSLHAPYIGRETDIASRNEEQRLQAVQLMTDTLLLAHQLNIKLVTIHPGYLDKTLSPTDQFGILQKSLDILKKEAEVLGITICIENTGNNRPNYIVLNYADHKVIFENYGVMLTLDLIHYSSFMKVTDDNYYPGIKEILPFTANIHIADMLDQKHSHLPLGKGNLPYHDILSFVYSNGYSGNSIIEERGGRYDSNEYISSSLEYKKYLDE